MNRFVIVVFLMSTPLSACNQNINLASGQDLPQAAARQERPFIDLAAGSLWQLSTGATLGISSHHLSAPATTVYIGCAMDGRVRAALLVFLSGRSRGLA